MALQPLSTNFYPATCNTDLETALPNSCPHFGHATDHLPAVATFNAPDYFRYLLGRDRGQSEDFAAGYKTEWYVTLNSQNDPEQAQVQRAVRLSFSVLAFYPHKSHWSQPAFIGTRIDFEANEALTRKIREDGELREISEALPDEALIAVLKPIVLSFLGTTEQYLHKLMSVRGRELAAARIVESEGELSPQLFCVSAATSKVYTGLTGGFPSTPRTPIGHHTETRYLRDVPATHPDVVATNTAAKDEIVQDFLREINAPRAQEAAMPTLSDMALERSPLPPVIVKQELSCWEHFIAFFKAIGDALSECWERIVRCFYFGC